MIHNKAVIPSVGIINHRVCVGSCRQKLHRMTADRIKMGHTSCLNDIPLECRGPGKPGL